MVRKKSRQTKKTKKDYIHVEKTLPSIKGGRGILEKQHTATQPRAAGKGLVNPKKKRERETPAQAWE